MPLSSLATARRREQRCKILPKAAMFSFSFSRNIEATQQLMASQRIVTSLEKWGSLCQTHTKHATCLTGTLGTVGIFRHYTVIQRNQRGSHVELFFTSRQQLTAKGYLLAFASAILAFAALCAGSWFLTVELAAVVGVTIIAVENRHARQGLLRASLEAQEAANLPAHADSAACVASGN